jgi:hypothetical protein
MLLKKSFLGGLPEDPLPSQTRDDYQRPALLNKDDPKQAEYKVEEILNH